MKKKWVFTIITFLIGFMIAIQFQTTQEPVVRDTRDIRELRKEHVSIQEKRQQITSEINKSKRLLEKYQDALEDWEDDISDLLIEQIHELREEVGLEEIVGEGIRITIKPLFEDQFLNDVRRTPPPHVFRYLVNELNIYGATAIAVENERIISNSAFRDVNQITYLNSRRLPPLPIEIKVLSEKSEALLNQMVVSDSVDYFEINGFSINFEIVDELVLPAYDQTPRVRYMKEVKEG